MDYLEYKGEQMIDIQNCKILPAEIAQDIKDTECEIIILRQEIRNIQTRIEERETFIKTLQAILNYRGGI